MDDKVTVDFDNQRAELGLKDDTVLFFKNFNGFWPLKKAEKKEEKGKVNNSKKVKI